MISHSGRKRAAIRKTSTIVDAQDYRDLIATAQQAFALRIKPGEGRLFETDASGLWDLYLKNIPARRRQEHNCHCCRNFIERFGGLVEIDAGGHATPAMWTVAAPGIYEAAFSALFHRVKQANVTGVFLTKDSTLGTPRSDPDWEHLHVFAPASIMWINRALTPGQRMASRKQDFITVRKALSEYGPEVLDQAIRLFDADALDRSEKFVAPVRWLRKLHDRPKGKLGNNVLWREIAAAPDGFCHVKASVVGPLLDAIVAGKPFDAIKAEFSAMLHPLRYQRPQAVPKAQALERAEALVEKLGLARSLERRFARLDEVPKLWEPPQAAPRSASGVFGHLKAKTTVAPVDLPETTITANKFFDRFMTPAERIEMLVPHRGNFIAVLTAQHDDAPVIMKWGNPFSVYVYVNGSEARQWRLSPLTWTKVDAIVDRPNMWERPVPELGEGRIFVLNGAADTNTGQGNALFPETLIADLHGARSTIEAYSKSAVIGGRDRASVCGYSIQKSGRLDVRLQVFANGGWASYRIDRWE